MEVYVPRKPLFVQKLKLRLGESVIEGLLVMMWCCVAVSNSEDNHRRKHFLEDNGNGSTRGSDCTTTDDKDTQLQRQLTATATASQESASAAGMVWADCRKDIRPPHLSYKRKCSDNSVN